MSKHRAPGAPQTAGATKGRGAVSTSTGRATTLAGAARRAFNFVKKRWWIIVLILAVVGTGGYLYSKGQAAKKAKANAIGRTTKVGRGNIAIKVTETGTLEPVSQVDVKSRVAGRLQKIYVSEGDTVRTGTPIALVDPTEVTRQVEGVKAQLAASRASLAQAEQNYRLTISQNKLAIARAEVALKQAQASQKDAEVAVRQAEAQYRLASAPNREQDIEAASLSVERAEAQLVDAKRSLTRQQSLLAKGYVAQTAVDSAQVQVTFAQKDLATQKERFALQKAGPRRVDTATARVGIEAAKSRLAGQKQAVAAARLALETEQTNAASAGSASARCGAGAGGRAANPELAGATVGATRRNTHHRPYQRRRYRQVSRRRRTDRLCDGGLRAGRGGGVHRGLIENAGAR